jgi:thiosulfate/3-mercaptopyruvate sulfurtransferase
MADISDADDALVTTEWLAERLGAPDIRVVDATWFLPNAGRDARAEYAAAHIPGAVYFDIDEIADESSPYPHAVPSAAKFSSRVRRLGLGDGVKVVAYDNNRFVASARAWWMFRHFGHEDVVVLDGGLAKWLAEGRPADDAAPRPAERHFTARQNNLLLRELDQVRANLTGRREQLVDARSPGRFAGTEPEPRPGLKAGHIPGSRACSTSTWSPRRHAQDRRRAAERLRRGRGRYRGAGRDHLRLGRLRRRPEPRPPPPRPPRHRPLRRLLDRVGLPARHAGGGRLNPPLQPMIGSQGATSRGTEPSTRGSSATSTERA